MDRPTLYHGLASTCSKKVRIALNEKGVAFESHLLDLQKREQRQPDYLALNPKGVVPTLVHRGRPIVESSIILEYVDEAFSGPKLRPDDLSERARMRLWLRFSDEVAYPAVAAPTWKYLQDRAAAARAARGEPEPETRAKPLHDAAAIETSMQRMDACIAHLENQLEATPWLNGAEFSLADAAVLPFASRIRNLRPDFTDPRTRPCTAGWLARAERRDSVKRALDFADDPRAAALPNI